MKTRVVLLALMLSSNTTLGWEGTSAASGPGDRTVAESTPTDAENTESNTRDEEGTTVTPSDQKEDATDLEITAAIRRAVVADESLSTNAHNVKIITQDGVVTLRGPVDSEAEKTRIVKLAQEAAGVKNLDNQLEIDRD